jgi:hypothetical protein
LNHTEWLQQNTAYTVHKINQCNCFKNRVNIKNSYKFPFYILLLSKIAMRKTLTLFALALAPLWAVAETIKMDLAEALSKHLVKMEAVNFKGNYTGKCMKLTITNTQKSTMVLKITPGIVLKADDTSYQPMILASEQMLAIQPSKNSTVEMYNFCGNSPRKCPGINMAYSFSHVANDKLMPVLKFIKENGLYDNLGQYAVWAITNNHEANEIYDPERPELSKKLIELVCSITRKDRPNYYTVGSSAPVAGQPAYNPKKLKIYAEFEIRLTEAKNLTLGVYDEVGNRIQKVFEQENFGAMGHRFTVEFEAEGVDAGNYYIRLTEAGKILQEKKVKVD